MLLLNAEKYWKELTRKPRDNESRLPKAMLAPEKEEQTQIKSFEYNMTGHARQCIERYCELADVDECTLKEVLTPCIDDHQLSPEDFQTKGKLHKEAARCVLKCLFLARIGRPDLLWTVSMLAREVTKWTVACDKRLLKFISYIKITEHYVQHCFIGDAPENCWIAMFCDASFAGYLRDSKSTTGAYVCLVGENTFMPLTWICKKQGAVSHSSTEAEIIVLEGALRMEGLPCLAFWNIVLTTLKRCETAEATTKPKHSNSMTGKGKYPMAGKGKGAPRDSTPGRKPRPMRDIPPEKTVHPDKQDNSDEAKDAKITEAIMKMHEVPSNISEEIEEIAKKYIRRQGSVD